MITRKYVNMVAKTIGRSKLTAAQRAHITNEMLKWMVEDNPAMNQRAFKTMANVGNSDVQNNSIS